MNTLSLYTQHLCRVVLFQGLGDLNHHCAARASRMLRFAWACEDVQAWDFRLM